MLYCTDKRPIVGATTLISFRGPPTTGCIEWTVVNGVELKAHLEISLCMRRYEAPFFKLTPNQSLKYDMLEFRLEAH